MSPDERGQALQDRLAESMPPMRALCSGDTPELFRSLMSRVGDKWTLLVIGVLGADRQRFTEIADMIPGISRRMLTVTLRALERDGLVTRTVYAEVPPRVEYEVTDLGHSLQSVAFVVGDWVGDHQHVIADNRRRFDAEVAPAPDGA
ncbi:winged helix-turn-helix transcriptional regulator [Clavibacter phaseoli]|uniref:winged helix-turn-helix transcriptional regulator n=1 Tax=Clavibacter phaseoli TaxID=1734031 RepID=UPI0027E02F19|nr:helix-turn-helix domain-containing protein [Clavibacter phaseoli]